jgi:hypothetical protein
VYFSHFIVRFFFYCYINLIDHKVRIQVVIAMLISITLLRFHFIFCCIQSILFSLFSETVKEPIFTINRNIKMLLFFLYVL